VQGGAYELAVFRPVCGNGEPEESETCDDGNASAGDGCDAECRAELSASGSDEAEPNDDFTSANLLVLAAGATLSVNGTLGGGCDPDQFVVDVPAQASLQVTLLAAGGGPCSEGSPPLTLTLSDGDGSRLIGSGEAPNGSACPAIDDRHAWAQQLAAGRYWLRATTDSSQPAFDYRIDFALVP
jgi:cysteine-rich repeat protein